MRPPLHGSSATTSPGASPPPTAPGGTNTYTYNDRGLLPLHRRPVRPQSQLHLRRRRADPLTASTPPEQRPLATTLRLTSWPPAGRPEHQHQPRLHLQQSRSTSLRSPTAPAPSAPIAMTPCTASPAKLSRPPPVPLRHPSPTATTPTAASPARPRQELPAPPRTLTPTTSPTDSPVGPQAAIPPTTAGTQPATAPPTAPRPPLTTNVTGYSTTATALTPTRLAAPSPPRPPEQPPTP